MAVIGVGLIGGSFSRALKSASAVGQVVGFDRDPENLAEAVRLGVIDTAASSLAEAVQGAELVFIAVPVGSVAAVVAQVAPFLPPGCIVTDGGSVKGRGGAGLRTADAGRHLVCGWASDCRD